MTLSIRRVSYTICYCCGLDALSISLVVARLASFTKIYISKCLTILNINLNALIINIFKATLTLLTLLIKTNGSTILNRNKNTLIIDQFVLFFTEFTILISLISVAFWDNFFIWNFFTFFIFYVIILLTFLTFLSFFVDSALKNSWRIGFTYVGFNEEIFQTIQTLISIDTVDLAVSNRVACYLFTRTFKLLIEGVIPLLAPFTVKIGLLNRWPNIILQTIFNFRKGTASWNCQNERDLIRLRIALLTI